MVGLCIDSHYSTFNSIKLAFVFDQSTMRCAMKSVENGAKMCKNISNSRWMCVWRVCAFEVWVDESSYLIRCPMKASGQLFLLCFSCSGTGDDDKTIASTERSACLRFHEMEKFDFSVFSVFSHAPQPTRSVRTRKLIHWSVLLFIFSFHQIDLDWQFDN